VVEKEREVEKLKVQLGFLEQARGGDNFGPYNLIYIRYIYIYRTRTI